jgi:uncharacterized protein YbaR (Trm112 family)
MTIDPAFLEILACPACRGPLAEDPDSGALSCGACRLSFPVEDGIPDLVVEEASPIE